MSVGTVSGIVPDEQWQLITSVTASGGSVSFTGISNAYKTLIIGFKNVTSSAGSDIFMRFNGDSTAGNYQSMVGGYGANPGSYGNNVLYITGWPSTSNTGYTVIRNANSTSMFKYIDKGIAYVSYLYGGMWYNETDAISSIVLSCAGSTWTGGTFYLYGIPA